MLVDANVLLFAANESAPEHAVARAWLEDALNGSRRVGLPWESLTAFVRLATNPRIVPRPLSPAAAWAFVDEWLASPAAWVPVPTDRHAEVLGDLVRRYRTAGKLVPDAHLAALAIEHGAEIVSADTDFARFTEVRWRNPVAGA
jgi:toxin-antitoxin system PIN domain toxin